MALCNSLQAAACLILCGAALTFAQEPNRPVPIASATETTIVDGGLGTAPPIELPRVESAPTGDATASLTRPFAQTTTAPQPNHLATRLLKIGLGGFVPISPSMLPGSKHDESQLASSGNGKSGLKGLLMRRRTVESVEAGQ